MHFNKFNNKIILTMQKQVNTPTSAKQEKCFSTIPPENKVEED